MIKLAELLRAGWRFQVVPEPLGPTLYAPRAVVQFVRSRDEIDEILDGPTFPVIDWISLWNFEADFGRVVDSMHARVFPISLDGMENAV